MRRARWSPHRRACGCAKDSAQIRFTRSRFASSDHAGPVLRAGVSFVAPDERSEIRGWSFARRRSLDFVIAALGRAIHHPREEEWMRGCSAPRRRFAPFGPRMTKGSPMKVSDAIAEI